MPKRSRRKPASSRPGPKPLRPTKCQRRQVELAIATGMTLPEIAAALDISRSTLSKVFAAEISTGRARRKLDNICRLDRAAAAGNVAAIKTLLTLMLESERTTPTPGDGRWNNLLAEYGIAPEGNSGRFSDFEKRH